ncbi:MAG: cytochrome c biogenesis protein CcsA [Bacteroidota bacterium]|nr:cytochrome c biogenesis protein CcsA [Bacteroidota bacterium]
MTDWTNFDAFALPTLGCWLLAVVSLYICKRKWLPVSLTLAGCLIFATFIGLLWSGLGRPPMRTMGETRLWYSLFLSGIGLVLFSKWKYNWILTFSLFMAFMFMLINLLKPEIHTKSLMPALQSRWFVPHVTAYILSYSFLTAATISAIQQLIRYRKNQQSAQLVSLTDNLVYIGLGLFMIGLLIGAVWAGESWGTFWNWDLKETWAFITASCYLLYIHLRLRETAPRRFTLWLLVLALICLMITWKGVNFLPGARYSVHLYEQ